MQDDTSMARSTAGAARLAMLLLIASGFGQAVHADIDRDMAPGSPVAEPIEPHLVGGRVLDALTPSSDPFWRSADYHDFIADTAQAPVRPYRLLDARDMR